MEYVIAAFSVRTDTVLFNKILQKNGVVSSVVETPKFASASCGISVRFAYAHLAKAKGLLATSGTKSFVRFFLVNGTYGNIRVTPLKR